MEDQQYIAKEKTKFFLKLSEISINAQKKADEIKRNRKFFKKAKHFLANTNETVIDIFGDTKKRYNDILSKEMDILKKVQELISIIENIEKCVNLQHHKEKEFSELLEIVKKKYITIIKKYVEDQFKNLFNMNFSHLRNALNVLIESGDENSEYKKNLLPEVEKLKAFYTDFHINISKLRYHYDSELIKPFRDKFKHISHLEDNPVLLPYFEKINYEINAVFDHLTGVIEENIKRETSTRNPEIRKLLKFYEDYRIYEKDFKIFSDSYDRDKYLEESKKLENLLKDISKTVIIKQNILTKLMESGQPISLIKKASNEINDINDTIVKITDSYLEIEAEKENLHNIAKGLKSIIEENLQKLLSPFQKRFLIKKDDVFEMINLWWESIHEIDEIVNQLVDIPEVTEKMKGLKQGYIDKILSNIINLCKEYVPKQGSIESHILVYEKSIFYLDKIEDFETKNQFEQELNKLRNFKIEFSNDYNKTINRLNKINVDFSLQDKYEQEKQLKTGIEFIRKYLNQEYLLYPEIIRQYNEIKNSLEKYKFSLEAYQDKQALRGVLILYDTMLKKRYVIFSSSVIEIGRMNNDGKIISENRINIPWKRVSAAHLQIDYQKGYIKDLNSSNGTYINRKGIKNKDEITIVDLNNVFEFNLSHDLTFSMFFNKKDFSFFYFQQLTNKNDLTLDKIDIYEFNDFFSATFFIYLPENSEFFINKLDGKPVNQIGDKTNYYMIKNKLGKYYYTDWKENVIDEIILISDNKRMKLHLENI
ncbi:MAG: FHA domain-containing protein [Candidatus Delongbacteria bacterium]|nr:FHA domain-containing protein [Candidatus Delongbacteria bacterium]